MKIFWLTGLMTANFSVDIWPKKCIFWRFSGYCSSTVVKFGILNNTGLPPPLGVYVLSIWRNSVGPFSRNNFSMYEWLTDCMYHPEEFFSTYAYNSPFAAKVRLKQTFAVAKVLIKIMNYLFLLIFSFVSTARNVSKIFEYSFELIK